MSILSLQKRIAAIEKLKDETKVAQEAIKNALDSDVAYQATAQEAKAMSAQKKRLREEVVNQADNREFVEKIKELKEEIGTLEELLAYELIEYSQQNNTDMIEGHDGLVRKFKITVRLLPGRGFDNEQSS